MVHLWLAAEAHFYSGGCFLGLIAVSESGYASDTYNIAGASIKGFGIGIASNGDDYRVFVDAALPGVIITSGETLEDGGILTGHLGFLEIGFNIPVPIAGYTAVLFDAGRNTHYLSGQIWSFALDRYANRTGKDVLTIA